MQFLDIVGEQASGGGIGVIDDGFDLAVDFPRGGFRHVLGLGDGVAEEHFLAVVAVSDHAELVAHAPFGDHQPRLAGRHLDVAGGAVGDLVGAEDDFLGGAATHRHLQFRQQLGFGFGVAIAFRQAHDQTQRAAAGNDRGFVHGVAFGFVHGAQRVAGLVIGGHALFGFRHHERAALGAHHHLVLGELELVHRDDALAHAGGEQRRFVDEVGEIGAGEAGRAAGDGLGVDIGGQRHLAHVNAEDFFAPAHVRVRHHNLAIEAAGAEQRGVQHVRTVGGGDQDDAFVGFEAVHFDQQLVQRLFTLIVAATEAGAAMAADRVDFVDEDDAGGVFLALLEHVADAGGTDADEHLDEVRAGDSEERHVRLTGDGAREQGLAGAGGADQQHALGDLAAEALEFLRVLEELDDFLQLGLGLVDAGDVVEGDAALLFRQQTGARLAEAHGPSAARLHLAHEEHPDADQQQHREPGQQIVKQRIDFAFLGLGDHPHALVGQALHQRGVFGGVGLEGAAIGQRAGDGAALDDHVAHAPAVHLADEVGIGDLGRWGMRGPRLEQVEEHHQKKGDDNPKREISAEIAHVAGSVLP